MRGYFRRESKTDSQAVQNRESMYIDELLQDESVDIVLNLTIPKVHYEINKSNLKRKTYLLRKPLH